jgi:transcriptional regulator with XRE-family HTH domain
LRTPAIDPIAAVLKAERHRQGLTLQQLGTRLGRSTHQSVWQWESGHNSPTLRVLREWAKALGYDVTLARGGRAPAPEQPPGHAT